MSTEYRLLNSAAVHALPALQWLVSGVLPSKGIAALAGPSGAAKSFLGLDLCTAIASGREWFGCRVQSAPVVYVALEGESGIRLRVMAWEEHHGYTLPDGFQMVLQPFKLSEPEDVRGLAAAAPAGAVIVLDTLNRAAPTADENSSRDMGEILESLKLLQAMTGGLVLLVHHTGKDATKGLRGHSSLFAALDAVIEVRRDGDRREWLVAKSKDGRDGGSRQFKLQVKELGVDEYGDPITSCVIVQDATAAFVKRIALPQGGNQKLVLDALRPLFAKGKQGIPGAPPARPCIGLDVAIAAGASHLTCQTDKRTSRARDAVTGLVAREVLGCNEGWLWLM